MGYSHFSYSSDIVFGQTQVSALDWVMTNVLPAQAGLEVTNVFYRYTAVKDPATGMIVYVQNKDTSGSGYIFRSVDDWTGLPGNTIVKSVPLNLPLGSRFGAGSIEVEGDGYVEDPTVIYSYRFDPCFNPQVSSDCEGFIPEIPDIPEVTDPLDDDYVQSELDRKAVMRSDEDEEEEREGVIEGSDEDLEKDLLEKRLGIALDSSIAATDNATTAALQAMNLFPNSYTQQLTSPEYKTTAVIPDNGTLVNSLVRQSRGRRLNYAQDKLHKELVRSQFER